MQSAEQMDCGGAQQIRSYKYTAQCHSIQHNHHPQSHHRFSPGQAPNEDHHQNHHSQSFGCICSSTGPINCHTSSRTSTSNDGVYDEFSNIDVRCNYNHAPINNSTIPVPMTITKLEQHLATGNVTQQFNQLSQLQWYQDSTNTCYLAQTDRNLEISQVVVGASHVEAPTLVAEVTPNEGNHIIHQQPEQLLLQQQEQQWHIQDNGFEVRGSGGFHLINDNPATNDCSEQICRVEESSLSSVSSAAGVNCGRETSNRTPPEKVIQRVKANKKERRRTQSINQAFNELRKHIPDVPSDTKLSKIKTLRLAISYISYMMSTLNEGEQFLDGGATRNNQHSATHSEAANDSGGGGSGSSSKALTNLAQKQPQQHHWATFHLKLAQSDELEPSNTSTAANTAATTSGGELKVGTSCENNGRRLAYVKQTSNKNSNVDCNFVAGTSAGRNKDRKHRTGWPEIIWKSSTSMRTIETFKKFEF